MKFQALLNLAPGAQFTVKGDEIIWQDENIEKPSDEDIQVEADRLLAEFPLNELREKRNKLLAETDWWELPTHAPMSAERTAYRKSLRDITETYTSLQDVVWPTKPN